MVRPEVSAELRSEGVRKQLDTSELSLSQRTRVVNLRRSIKPRKQIKSGGGLRTETRVFRVNLREYQQIKGSWQRRSS